MAQYNPYQVVRYDVSTSGDDPAAFWTGERRRSARPVPLLRGRKPEGRAGDEMRRQPAAPAASSQPVSNIAAFPYSTVGKLFFCDQNNEISEGTAWIVADSIIATVGHTVCYPYEGAQPYWFTEMLFIPQYDRGVGKFGSFQIKTYFTLQGWIDENGKDPTSDYDLALCRTTTPMPINSTGVLSLQSNVNLVQGTPVTAVGYPGGPQFNDQMYESQGQFLYDTDPDNSMYASNLLTGGASGGPWVVKNQLGQLIANGINSMGIDDGATWASPYFGEGIDNLWAAANAGEPDGE